MGDVGAIAPYSQYLTRPLAEVQRDLESFSALLLKWNAVQNLVSRETESAVWQRHIVDSVQILPLLRHGDERILDIGSGGGLPAIPLAICRKGAARLTLVEPVSKKVAFLRTVIRELGLDAEVVAGRVEQIDSRETAFDTITSRALAGLPQLLQWVFPLFGPRTQAIFLKGKDHEGEIQQSRLAWEFDVVLTKSSTDDGGALLQITNLRRKTNP